MVIRQYLPLDLAPRGKRHSARTTLIVTASLGVHAVVAGYLAMMQFAPPKAAPEPREKVFEAPLVDLLPKKPPPTENKIRPLTPRPPLAPVDTPVPPIEAPPLPKVTELQTPTLPTDIGPPVETPPPVSPPDIRNPTWLKKPGASEFARLYPDREMRREIEGRAVLTCQVTATGSVTACRVASQTPADSGFGAAALKLSRYFVMSPRTVDGRAVEGSQVSVPITFNLN